MHTLRKIDLLIDSVLDESNFGSLSCVWEPIWGSKHPYSNPHLRLFKTVDKIKTLTDTGISFEKKKVLDVGCGDGSPLSYLEKVFGCEGCGIDVSTSAINDAKKSNSSGNLYFQVGDARAIPFGSKTFDIVLSWGVVEHLSQDLLALSEAYRVLRPGGLLILIQPNLASFAVIQEWFLKIQKKWSFGRHKKYSATRWKRELRRCGFSSVKSFARPPYQDMPIVRIFDKVVRKIFPFCGHYLYIIATR